MKQNCSYKPMIVEDMLRRSVLPLLLMFMLFQPLTALARRTMYGRLNTDTQTLTIYYDDNWQKGDFTIPSNGTPYWRYNDNLGYKGLAKIKTVVFDPSFKDARLKDCSWWFSGFKGLTTITHLEYLNTSQVTNMQYMFSNCESLEALDLSTFNTENVTNMSNMFYYCKSLKSLNLSSFNTSKVNYMGSMFHDCESLTALNLSSFNTENISDYEYMFHCCKSLTALDLSSFNSKEILNTSCMFTGCIALKTIDISSFDTSKTTNMSFMFSGCSALETIYASSAFTTDNVKNDSYMFSTCTKLKNYTGSGKTHAHIGEGGYFTVAPAWVRFDAATGTLTFQCSSAKTDADTDFFLNEGSDVPGWYPAKSADIKTVVFKRNFRDARPTTCLLWFGSCTNLTSIEGLENLNTSDVTRMDYMFYKCEQLRALDLSGFNTEKVEDMRDMFSNCKNLETLNLSSFKTNNLTNMSEMFLECNKIAQLDLSGFNTSGVKALDQVFKRCYALESLDLSSFDTKLVTEMSSLFDNCQNLKTIYVSDRFSTYRVKYSNSTNMFNYCDNLKGATAFADIQKKDKERANYTDGYFTKKVGMNGPDIIGATGSQLEVVGLTLSDDKAFELYEACFVQNGSYTRPMASTWGTLCLPYVIKPSDRNTCLFYKIETMEDDKVLLTEITRGHILAGTPLVVRKKDDSQKDISIYSEYAMMSTAPSNDNANPLKGTFSTTELTDDCYFIAKNQFRLVKNYKGAATGVKVAGFRAYLQPETTAGSKRANVLSIGIDDEATGIESAEVIDWLNNPSAEYYDLKGRRVEGLQKGINIVKVGKRVKKVVINK